MPLPRPATGLVCAALCAAAVAGSTSPAHAATSSGARTVAPPPARRSGPTGRLLVTVRTRHGASHRVVGRAVDDVARRAGSRAVQAAPDTDGAAATAVVPAGDAAARSRLAAALRRDPRVVDVETERRAAPRLVPDDPALLDPDPLAPAGVTGAWWATRMGLPAAWSLADGRGVTIAVIDTGFDVAHPQLRPVVTHALESTASGDLAGTARTDEIGHGTHVASLACSAFDDGQGTVGAGGRCHLITIKSDLFDSSVADAIDRATRLGADVISMSFGVDGAAVAPRIVREALERAAAHDVVLVAAAADTPTAEQGYPANVLQPTGSGRHPSEGIGLTVTAALADGHRAAFAGRGSQISVAGYGAYADSGGPPGILGAFPAGTVSYELPTAGPGGSVAPPIAQRTEVRGDPRYAYESGTSMATPIVAGVAGLMRDVNPRLSAAQIVRILKRSSGTRWSADVGWGTVDGYRAVDAARRVDLRAPVATSTQRSRTLSAGRTVLRWTVSDRAPQPLVASGVRTVEVWRSVDGGRFRRVASGARGHATVSLLPGRNRIVLRGVDRAGNRAPLSTRRAVVLVRR